jgi:tight adherence protein B
MGGALLLWGGAVLLFAGIAVFVLLSLGGLEGTRLRGSSLEDRMAIYTLGEAPPRHVGGSAAAPTSGLASASRSAALLAGRLVRGSQIEGSLAHRLDQAALPLDPGEWLLVHAGCALGLALLLGLLSDGQPGPALLGLLVGGTAPLAFLRLRATRRKNAFDSQLADSLQLLAGSLRAGYSVPQAIDAIVREGAEPMTTEFGRALVEARLGVPLEDALESVGTRMRSIDFGWVVMAMRIQHDVGGNLAEVLTNVAATLRERERLRRQVRVLSAEGRLSAWILGLLPLVFGGYLLLVRPDYLRPLWTTTLGWLMLVVALSLFVVGVFWLRRVVRVVV